MTTRETGSASVWCCAVMACALAGCDDVDTSTAQRAAVDAATHDAATVDASADVSTEVKTDGAAAPDAVEAVVAPLPLTLTGPLGHPATHTSSIAVSPDGARVYVVNADADSVSVIDVEHRRLEREIALGNVPPAVDPETRRYEPRVGPRALALSPRAQRLYVTGQRSSELLVIDLSVGAVVRRVTVGSEPMGVLVAPDEAAVFVAVTQESTLTRLDAVTFEKTSMHTMTRPWGLGWSSDGGAVLVTQFLGDTTTAAVSRFEPASLRPLEMWTVPETPPQGIVRQLSHGRPRGLYDVAPRPGTAEVWVPHLLLSPDPVQTDGIDPDSLRFDNLVFPAVTVLGPNGAMSARLSTGYAPGGIEGAFAEPVSGPHAVDFTPDGRYALLVDTNSEDVVLFDAEARRQVQLVRGLPGHMLEGVAVSPDGARVFVDARNTAGVVVLSLDRGGASARLSIDGGAIPRLTADPMPARMRFGQRVFFSANEDDLPVTREHRVACVSCHVEGRSDAVVWRFLEGPRDTPSNAGGVAGTGLLFRTAARRFVSDYFHTIHIEQGGEIDPEHNPTDRDTMLALQEFVNFAIPYPVPPRTDPALVALGREVFFRKEVGCGTCHHGPFYTDSGDGNPTLDLAGPLVLWDVGTCNHGEFPDVPHRDDQGRPRQACLFDTPTLRGIAESAPYLHDGRAATLHDVLERTRGTMGDIRSLTPREIDALVEFMRSL